jgi:hypothetical protein
MWRSSSIIAAALGLLLSAAPVRAGDHPKEIQLEGSDGKPVLDPVEQQATDAALVSGATDLQPPLRIITRDQTIHEEILMQAGRCYELSVAAGATWALNVGWTFQPTLDGKQVSDGHPNGRVRTHSGGGVVQLCVDRTGTIIFDATFDANAQDFHGQAEFVLVVGWRVETPAQWDARHRCLSSPRKNLGDC